LRHYSLLQARRSLVLFGVGRSLSAVSGFAVLILMVRVMPTSEYGAFVAFIAFLEIFYLLSGFGLSSVAQRYVPEFRLQASAQRLEQLIGFACLARVLAASLCALLVVLAAAPLLNAINIEMPPSRGVPFVLLWCGLLVSGCAIRFLDELLAALLLQGTSQGLVLMRNIGKLGVLLFALIHGVNVDVAMMLGAEVMVSVGAIALGSVILWRELAKRDGQGDPEYVAPGMWSISLRFYLIQVLGQVYGPNAIKLLVSRILGLDATAVLGFAQALTDMLRNYLPAHLLAGWIRPLLVSRFVSSGSVGKLGLHAGLVLKINIYGVMPLVLAFAIAGDAIGQIASGSKFLHAGAPLALLSVLIGLQTAHLLLNMITVTLQKPNSNIIATLLATSGLAVAWTLTSRWGMQGAIAGMMLAETIWIGTVWILIARLGIMIELQWAGIVKILGTGIAVGSVALLAQHITGKSPPYLAIAAAAATTMAYLGILFVLRPLAATERAVINKFVPEKWLPL
jgi:O-antigen/teichoic acid export membrane protein